MCAKMMTTIGLVLDIVGVCVLYRYGFGGASRRVDALNEGVVNEMAKRRSPGALTSQRERQKGRKLAWWGLVFLLVGFALQILAQWLPALPKL